MIHKDQTCNYPKKRNIEFVSRLILIGNGFDLAHGYKTKYTDFLYDYFKNAFLSLKNKGSYSDQLFKVSNNLYE